MNPAPGPSQAQHCSGCGCELAPALLACPRCKRLVHTNRLQQIAREAEQAQRDGRVGDALAAWRSALALLPHDSVQYGVIKARVQALSNQITHGAAPVPPAETKSSSPQRRETAATAQSSGATTATGVLTILGAAALLLWKFKFALGFILTKGKLLLLGLTKASTFFSMILSMGVYWSVFGWKFAVGLVLSIYIHEMGHVAQLRRYGIKATAPMFIPGVGAMIRLKQYPATPGEDARVGLAGPMWGLAAAAGAYAVSLATGWASWAAIARVGAWINLFNLIPVWQLDGSHAFRALTKKQRWLACGGVFAAWFLMHEGMLALVLLVAVIRAFTGGADKPDRFILVQFIFLVVTLTALTLVPIDMTALR